MTEQLQILQQWIDESNNIVFFSGSGVSIESGIPDFRDIEDTYFDRYDSPPEAILTRSFFERNPQQFFAFYRERILAPLTTAEPNATHLKLVELEAARKLNAVITQNMDDLHQEAGSQEVVELWGSVMRNNCPRCERRISTLEILEQPKIPYCDVDMCGAVMTPDIYLYGDTIPEELLAKSIYYTRTADLLIVAGTSLQDYPAAQVIYYYPGKRMVLIHPFEHPLDTRANLVIHAPVHEVMEAITVSHS